MSRVAQFHCNYCWTIFCQ